MKIYGFSKEFKKNKGSSLTEKILVTAFAVAMGGAVIAFGANAISSHKDIDLMYELDGRNFGYNQKIRNAELPKYMINGNVTIGDGGVFTYTFTNPKDFYWDNRMDFNIDVPDYDETHDYLSVYYIKTSKNLYTLNYPFATGGKLLEASNDWQIVCGVKTGCKYGFNNGSSTFSIQFSECATKGWQVGESFQMTPPCLFDLTTWFKDGDKLSKDDFVKYFSKMSYPFQSTPSDMSLPDINNLGSSY